MRDTSLSVSNLLIFTCYPLSKVILNPIFKVVIMPCGLSSAFVQTVTGLCCGTGSLSSLKLWLTHFLKAHT